MGVLFWSLGSADDYAGDESVPAADTRAPEKGGEKEEEDGGGGVPKTLVWAAIQGTLSLSITSSSVTQIWPT